MTARAVLASVVREQLDPLITREIAGIGGIDAAMARAPSPDYVVMFHDTKNGKQANVEQMATLLRMHGASSDEAAGTRKAFTKAQVVLSSHVSAVAMLRSLRTAEVELVTLYSDAARDSAGIVRRALTKILARALVHAHVLTAHLARRTGRRTDVDPLPAPLEEYFAGPEARACMRCHLDRPGAAGALERGDPHPYTFICSGCHDDVLGEFSPDLAAQMDRWPREVREAKVIQQAIGRTSKLNAIGRVLYPLSGLAPDLPSPAAERALIVPAGLPTPGPAAGERRGVIAVDAPEGLEGDYARQLFSVRQIWSQW